MRNDGYGVLSVMLLRTMSMEDLKNSDLAQNNSALMQKYIWLQRIGVTAMTK